MNRRMQMLSGQQTHLALVRLSRKDHNNLSILTYMLYCALTLDKPKSPSIAPNVQQGSMR